METRILPQAPKLIISYFSLERHPHAPWDVALSHPLTPSLILTVYKLLFSKEIRVPQDSKKFLSLPGFSITSQDSPSKDSLAILSYVSDGQWSLSQTRDSSCPVEPFITSEHRLARFLWLHTATFSFDKSCLIFLPN